MGDNDQRFTFCQLINGMLQFIFIFRVCEGGSLVQNHDRCIFQDCPCYGKTLALTTGKPCPGVTGIRIVTFGETCNKFVTSGLRSRPLHFLVSSVRFSNANVVTQAHIK